MTKLEKSSEGVYFLSLSLENVRCFGTKQKLDLSDGSGRPAPWTVILGDNGTGKTTLLQVLADGYTFSINGARSLPRIGSSHSKIELCHAVHKTLENKQGDFKQLAYQMELGVDGLISISNFDDSLCKIKIFAYSAGRRKHSSDLLKGSGVKKRFFEQDELINAEEWLLQTDYIANKASEIQGDYKERLKIIKDVLINLLPDVKDIRISDPSENAPNPRVEFRMPDGWLLYPQLSLGYQTMIAWMVDLVAQLFKDYSNSPNPIAEPAVVLIDEIDLHLHPKWQRTIMSYLSERFVNTQFIVTAHSPLIVQAAENANIVVLKREGEGDGVVIHRQDQDVHGWRIDQLLTSDLFELKSARSPHYESLLEQRRQILSKAKLGEEDKMQLKTLEAEIGDLPTAETAEDIQAMDIIRRAAQVLKQAQ